MTIIGKILAVLGVVIAAAAIIAAGIFLLLFFSFLAAGNGDKYDDYYND
jgi:ABC-type Na+ efflux pump permease subunit